MPAERGKDCLKMAGGHKNGDLHAIVLGELVAGPLGRRVTEKEGSKIGE